MNPTAPDPARRLAIKRTAIITVCLVAVYVTGCTAYMNDWFKIEESVIASTVGSHYDAEATLVQRDGGATVSTSYSVRLSKSGTKKKWEVLLINRVSDPETMKLEWTEAGLLVTLPSEYEEIEKLESVEIDGTQIQILYKESSD